MTVTLRIVFLVASICVCFFVIFKIRKSQLQIADAIAWILGSLLLILLCIFPTMVDWFASLLGFYSTSNFILTLISFFLLIIAFLQNIRVSILSEKLKNLNHHIALTDKEKAIRYHGTDTSTNIMLKEGKSDSENN